MLQRRSLTLVQSVCRRNYCKLSTDRAGPGVSAGLSKVPKTVSAEEALKRVDPKIKVQDGNFPGMPKHKVRMLDRVCLVWAGRYKSFAEIPERVEHDEIHSAKTWCRVRFNILAIVVGCIGSAAMVYLGKKAAFAGESVHQDNLNWHKSIREERAMEEREKK